ncbi:hypothetical protein LZ30DRAFT_721903 [Colletotrichum cereale]|nr:hypothetical protein LZ30DRAFT_721903 [Colletotrichum cereale]
MPSKANYAKIVSLREEIYDCFKVNYNGREFFPIDQLGRLATRQNVSEILATVSEDMETLTDFATNDAARLFLILILMTTPRKEQVSLMRRLHDSGLKDDCLPVTFRKDDVGQKWLWIWGTSSSANFSCLIPEDWSRSERELFNKYQWRFIIPIFGTRQPFCFQFDSHIRLPYLEVEKRAESEWFFGEVRKVKIHYAYIRSPELAQVSIT